VDILFQIDDVCRVEKAVVAHAWNLWPGPDAAPQRLYASLAQLQEGRVVPPWDPRASVSSLPRTPIVPVGTVEFCRAWMRATGVQEPEPLDYPMALRAALGRPVERLRDYSLAPDGAWVKPVRTKAWPAHRKGQDALAQELQPCGEVWTSPNLALQAEWRVYVLEGRVVGQGRYDDGSDHLDSLASQATSWAQQLAHIWSSSAKTPAAYALDVAFTHDAHWALVEVTDAWAIGYYRGSCSAQDYLRMLMARWKELASAH
jgi:hypothetical protein